MSELKLFGMKAAFDEIVTTAVKRQHEPQRVVGDLLEAEIVEKQARSIKYQITIAKLPLSKDLNDFTFNGTLINETLVRDLAGGEFLAHERNVVLTPIGGQNWTPIDRPGLRRWVWLEGSGGGRGTDWRAKCCGCYEQWEKQLSFLICQVAAIVQLITIVLSTSDQCPQ